MTIEQVYKKYEHMDSAFKDLAQSSFAHKMLGDMWAAIKEYNRAQPATAHNNGSTPLEECHDFIKGERCAWYKFNNCQATPCCRYR